MEDILTRRQVQVLEFIDTFRRGCGYSPTLRETASALGLSSVATVAEHVDSLEAGGFLRRERDRARSATLTARGRSLLAGRLKGAGAARADSVSIPLMGLIAAGSPIEALEVPEELDIPASMAAGRRCYALKVSGESMVDEGIFDGDYVVVEHSAVAENGETVVALLDGTDATLKKFYRDGQGGASRIRLQPANPKMRPLILDPERRVEIQGRVRGVIRMM